MALTEAQLAALPVGTTNAEALARNAADLDRVLNGDSAVTNRRGASILSMALAMADLGFEAPVAFGSGIVVTRATQVVTRLGVDYHAEPSALPFTTTGTFNAAQWVSISNATAYGLATDLASTASGKGAALVGFDWAVLYSQYTAGWGIRSAASTHNVLRWVTPSDWAAFLAGGIDAGPGIRAAVAGVKALGGGTVYLPHSTLVMSIASDSDAILIDSSVSLVADPGTTLTSNSFSVPTIAVVGASDVRIQNIRFIFSGTRPGAAPATTARFGFASTGVSGADWSAHIVVAGSNRVKILHCDFTGLTSANVKEGCVSFFGGSAAGVNFDGGTAANPGANAVYNTDNEVGFCTFSDYYFGITSFLQDGLQVHDHKFTRYNNSAFVGAGHAYYMTGQCRYATIRDFDDKAEFVTTPGGGTYPGAVSWQFRSAYRCQVHNLRSNRPEGSHSIQNSTRYSVFDGIHWSADRYPYEGGLVNTPVITVVQADGVSIIEKNQYSNWFINDELNAGAARSANCPVIGNGGSTSVSANTRSNNWKNINITFAPGSAFGKSVIVLNGQYESAEFVLRNLGTGTTKSLLQMLGSAAGTMSGNVVDLTLMGGIASFNVSGSNSNQDNIIRVHGAGALANTGSGLGSGTTAATGDKILFDPLMYQVIAPGTRTPDCLLHSSIEISLSATATTINAPLNPYVGARLRFRLIQDGTGGRTITWNAAFKKAADGAGAANACGLTEFEYNGTNWIQRGGALAYL